MRPLEVYELPHCACCGQLVTWETVHASFEGKELNFCSPKCVEVFDTYLLPSQSSELFKRLDRSAFVSFSRD